MIYPKGIMDFVLSDSFLLKKFANLTAGRALNTSSEIPATSSDFERWIFKEGHYHHSEIKRYVYFLSLMAEIFNNISRFFSKAEANKANVSAIGTSPAEMLYIARYIYYLDSYSIKGDVLECGCFKGFSSCCLSWACNFLRKKLVVADSFQGLPPSKYKEEIDFFDEFQYKGGFNEVKENLKTLGKIENVEFIPGWYQESLIGFNKPLCLIWMDVDLYQSVLDVLNNVYSSLIAGGVIFSHEFVEHNVKNGHMQNGEEKNVQRALANFFMRKKISYKTKFLIKRLGIVVPNNMEENILLSPKKQRLIMGFISKREEILYDKQIARDNIMLVIDFLKDIPLFKSIIRAIANILRGRRG